MSKILQDAGCKIAFRTNNSLLTLINNSKDKYLELVSRSMQTTPSSLYNVTTYLVSRWCVGEVRWFIQSFASVAWAKGLPENQFRSGSPKDKNSLANFQGSLVCQEQPHSSGGQHSEVKAISARNCTSLLQQSCTTPQPLVRETVDYEFDEEASRKRKRPHRAQLGDKIGVWSDPTRCSYRPANPDLPEKASKYI